MSTTGDTITAYVDAVTTALVGVVRAAIKESGLSRREVSRRSGIPATTLERRLRLSVRSPFTVVELVNVGRALDVDPVSFFRRADADIEGGA